MFPAIEADFGLNLLRHGNLNESLVISPLSVIFTLAMIQAGAKNRTKSEIDNVIGRGSSDTAAQQHYSELFRKIQSDHKGVKSRIANGLFVNKQYHLEENYTQAIAEKYGAMVRSLDFRKLDNAVKEVNDFVKNATDGKIKDIVNEQEFKGAQSLIANAVYFNAHWLWKFYKFYNSMRTFYSYGNSTRQVEFMRHSRTTRMYAEDEDVQVLSLPYLDMSYAFNIILPKQRFGLRKMIEEVDGKKIQNLLSKVKETFVSVIIPKMKVETRCSNLKKMLITMGVSRVFTGDAELSGIVKDLPLHISNIAHRAIIEVNENGTMAAAVSLAPLRPMRLNLNEPKEFLADHPFLFILTKDKNPLFMGQFA